MGENTAIAWCDHTWNPWWGCSRVSPGCEHCYAETLATVRRKLPVWGVDAQRKPMSEDYWRAPIKWNAKAERAGTRRRVFCASMADVFEIAPARNVDANLTMTAARARLWDLIERTPALDWLLLTKRPHNIERLLAPRWLSEFPSNVWLGITAEDQERYDKRWPILRSLSVSPTVRFVSHEPALGPLDLLALPHDSRDEWDLLELPDWIITGGESGPGARPYDLGWARDLVAQTKGSPIAMFVKQLGADPIDGLAGYSVILRDRKGGDPSEWPEELRVQQFPRVVRAEVET